MPKAKPFYYLVDRLTREKAEVLQRSLRVVADIREVTVNVARNMIELSAFRDVEAQVRLACDVANVTFRTRAKL